jgi:flagellar basal body rod protein FlgC
MSLMIQLTTSLAASDCNESVSRNDIILANATLIRPDLETSNFGHIVVRGDKIVGVYENCKLSKQTKGLENFKNLENRFIMPGLHDMHVHNFGRNLSFANDISAKLDDQGIEPMNYRMLFAGVTTHLDLMSVNKKNVKTADGDGPYSITLGELRDRQRKGEKKTLGMSNIFMAGKGIMMEGDSYQTWLPDSSPGVYVPKKYTLDPIYAEAKSGSPEYKEMSENILQLINEIYSVASGGPDVIKIIYDHNQQRPGDYASKIRMTKTTLDIIAKVAKAKQKDVKIVCHIGTWQDAKDCIDAGASALTHIPFSNDKEILDQDGKVKIPYVPIMENVVDMMIDKNIFLIETMTAYMEPGFYKEELIANASDFESRMESDSLLKTLSTEKLRNTYYDMGEYVKADGTSANDWIDWAVEHNSLGYNGKGYRPYTFNYLMKRGVKILSGTDTMWESLFFGFSIHQELMHMSNFSGLGMVRDFSLMKILQTTTSNADEFLNHKRGRIRNGYKADLLILGSSPAEDILNTRDIQQVMVNGQLVELNSLCSKMYNPQNAEYEESVKNCKQQDLTKLSIDEKQVVGKHKNWHFH